MNQLHLISNPQQLNENEWKFYKDVKPKTNFLSFKMGLQNCFQNIVELLMLVNRRVGILSTLYFQDGELTRNQKIHRK